MAHYQVQDPSGEMHTIEGPDGATPDQVMAQAQSLVPPKETSWGDVPVNAAKDVYGMGKSVLKAGQRMADPFGLIEGAAKGSMEPIEKATIEPLETAKGLVNDVFDTVSHPIEHFKQHPVNTAMYALPLAEKMMPEMPAGAPESAPMAQEPPIAPKAPGMAASAPNSVVPEEVAAPPTPESVPLGSTFQETVANLGKKLPEQVKAPMQQVQEYLKGKYDKVASNPNWANTLADYTKEHAQNMVLKELGASPGQVRKIGGADHAHELADYAKQRGLTGTKIGTIGREKMMPVLEDQAGGAVGGLRKIAADRGAVHDANALVDSVKAELDQKYLQSGMYSGQKGTYMKALAELKKMTPTADAVADKVSEMFKESKNQDPLRRPNGPLADVARVLNNKNHELIAKNLKPEELNAYEHALEDYGALKQIHEFVKRRASTEAGGRLGPGSGISRMAVQKFLDNIGYRTQSDLMYKMSDYIKKNPEVAKSPTKMFRKYIDEAAEAADEMGDAAQ